MSAPDFTDAMLEEQVRAWLDCADALRRGDRRAAADHMAGDARESEQAAYCRSVTMCTIGASLCAAEIAKLNGHQLGDAPDLYVLRSQHPLGVLDEHSRCAAQCITYASNGDFEMVADLVNAHHRPEDSRTGLGLMTVLMTTYLSLTGGAS